MKEKKEGAKQSNFIIATFDCAAMFELFEEIADFMHSSLIFQSFVYWK